MRLGHWAGDSKAPEGSGASVGLLVWRAGSWGSWLRGPRYPRIGVSQLLPGAGSGGCRAPGSPGASAGPLESVDESQGGLLRGPTCLGAGVSQLFQRAWYRVADHWVPGGWLWDHGVPGIGASLTVDEAGYRVTGRQAQGVLQLVVASCWVRLGHGEANWRALVGAVATAGLLAGGPRFPGSWLRACNVPEAEVRPLLGEAGSQG